MAFFFFPRTDNDRKGANMETNLWIQTRNPNTSLKVALKNEVHVPEIKKKNEAKSVGFSLVIWEK